MTLKLWIRETSIRILMLAAVASPVSSAGESGTVLASKPSSCDPDSCAGNPVANRGIADDGCGAPGRLPALWLQLAFDVTGQSVAPQPLSFTVTNLQHRTTTFLTAITGRASARWTRRFVTADAVANRARNLPAA